MTESSYFERMSRIERAWLDELNLVHRLKDDATEDERTTYFRRAADAALSVETAFADLKAKGKLRNLAIKYRQARLAAKAAGRKVKPWSAYILVEKINMVRALAREQRARALRGMRS